MTELFASPAVGLPNLCFPARSAKEAPSARMAIRQMTHIFFDLEIPLGAAVCCSANPGCVTFSSLSSRYRVTCYVPERLSDAPVHAPLVFEMGIGAPRR